MRQEKRLRVVLLAMRKFDPWKGVPSVPAAYCRRCDQKLVPFDQRMGSFGQLWQVWREPPRVPQTLDSPLHHPLWERDISYHDLHWVLCGSPPRTLSSDFSGHLVTWLKASRGSDRSEWKQVGRPSLLETQNIIPHRLPDLIIRSSSHLEWCIPFIFCFIKRFANPQDKRYVPPI